MKRLDARFDWDQRWFLLERKRKVVPKLQRMGLRHPFFKRRKVPESDARSVGRSMWKGLRQKRDRNRQWKVWYEGSGGWEYQKQRGGSFQFHKLNASINWIRDKSLPRASLLTTETVARAFRELRLLTSGLCRCCRSSGDWGEREIWITISSGISLACLFLCTSSN